MPHSESEAMSLKMIARALSIDTPTYADRIRVSRNLARVLRILIKWGWVACSRRQRVDGNKFWHNVYWRIEPIFTHETMDRTNIPDPASLKEAFYQ